MTAPSVLFAPLRDDCYAVGLSRAPHWMYVRRDFGEVFGWLRAAAEHRGVWRLVPHGDADPYAFRNSLGNRLRAARIDIAKESKVLADELLPKWEKGEPPPPPLTRVESERVYLRVPKGDRHIDTKPLADRSVYELGRWLMLP